MDTRYLHDEFELGGYFFRVYTDFDDTNEAPWDRDCIYDGVVSDWKRDSNYERYIRKAPYERILCRDRYEYRTFDVQQFIKVALSHGCTRQQAHEQSLSAFERLRRWCNGDWNYIGVIVEAYASEEDAENGEDPLADDSLWGIESDQYKYINETAKEIADGIRYSLNREATEANELAARGIVTV